MTCPRSLRILAALAALPLVVLPASTPKPAAAQAMEASPSAIHVVEVEAEDYAFRIPGEIASGWTTFQFTNQGEEHHFMLIARLPDGITFDDYATDVVMAFNEAWYELRDGRIGPEDIMPLLGEDLPEWYGAVEFMGGPGFLAPGASGTATVNLEPGQYIVECYVRTADGEIHAMEGMLDPLVVTGERSDEAAPSADLRVVLSQEGLTLDGRPEAGLNTFEVYWADHPEGTFGHDVHVVRLDDDTTTEELLYWINFFNVDAFSEPVPGTFVGGINMMPAGTTAYFSATLEPGRYLLVSEYTGAMGVLQEFTVEAR